MSDVPATELVKEQRKKPIGILCLTFELHMVLIHEDSLVPESLRIIYTYSCLYVWSPLLGVAYTSIVWM